MKRREFITLVSGAVALPFAARAQQTALPAVGFLSAGSLATDAFRVAAVRQGLMETGYVEGRNVAFEYRWAEGHNERLAALATELVRREVAVIVAIGGNISAVEAKSATATIPIIFEVGADPIKLGRRRKFIKIVGGALAAWPLAVRAQQRTRLPIIGFLGPTSRSAWSVYVSAFVQRLDELGWIDGRTATIEYRWADGRQERYSEIAAEFVRNKVDIIVTGGSSGAAAKQATAVIPIVLAVSNDPVGDGLAASLARPGGNITGLSVLAPELAGKRLENLRQVLPRLRRLSVLGDAGYPAAVLEMSELQTTARKLGLEADTLAVRTAEDIAAAIEQVKGHADALYVSPDSLTATNSVRIGELALKAQLPTMHGVREFVQDGGLMSYGPNLTDLFRRSGDYVDKILRGAKPEDLPIEQPTKFELVINLKTAKALGVAVPEALLARADEVIE